MFRRVWNRPGGGVPRPAFQPISPYTAGPLKRPIHTPFRGCYPKLSTAERSMASPLR